MPVPIPNVMAGDRPHISVCICTYRRPELLSRLLQALRCQETAGQFTYSIVVADNDASQSAKEVVLQFAARCSFRLTYCVEAEQNIALARNMSVSNAKGDFIAFIDDDEFPAKDWLLNLFQTCEQHAVAGVLGPVIPYFEERPPLWVEKGGFYDRPSHPTGFRIDWTEGRTGNMLFRHEILEGTGPVFLPEFGGGGEDRNFFKRMIESGRVFIWCNEAIAYELVPPIRWNRNFMLRRALLRGKMALNRAGKAGLVKSLVAIIAYTVALPVFLIMGQHVFMKYLIKICDHAGKLLAFVGLNPIRERYVSE
jgi:succinoglycan biosynthesis protein ExoM